MRKTTILVALAVSVLSNSISFADASANSPDCHLVLMIEGPMDSSGHNFLRIDQCGETSKKVHYRVESEKPAAKPRQRSVAAWKTAIAQMQKEVELLAGTPEEESTRCFQPVHVYWKNLGEPQEISKCPAGKVGERVQALVAAARSLSQ